MGDLSFVSSVKAALKGADVVVFLAPAKMHASGWATKAVEEEWAALLAPVAKEVRPGHAGGVASTFTGQDRPLRLYAAVLPDKVSRHNSPARHEAVAGVISRCGLEGKKTAIVVGLDDENHYVAVANAIGRALPDFTRKTGKQRTEGRVVVVATDASGTEIEPGTWVEEVVANARWAARMVDTPTAELSTADFVTEAKKLVKGLKHVRVREIVGEELLEAGLGGIHAVGRAAVIPPRLLLLEYKPKKTRRTIGLIGKGIVYDTGGLSLKQTSGMCSMKGDMGGGAACVGAFRTLVVNGSKDHLICAVPLAENAIGPKSYRNDDIIVMHSKKTVEINNTDAEGRLLLADALSYVGREYGPSLMIDAATLTGAQLVTSGLRHSSIVSNREGIESLAVRVGRASGDLAHAILFAPEFLMPEFDSRVADMQNSVKDRANAQSSCAGQFVYAHIDDLDIAWLHVDLAGPAWRDGRGTGYGVALMAGIVDEVGERDLES